MMMKSKLDNQFRIVVAALLACSWAAIISSCTVIEKPCRCEADTVWMVRQFYVGGSYGEWEVNKADSNHLHKYFK